MEEKSREWYMDENGKKTAHLFDREGRIIDTELNEGHLYQTKRKCPICGSITEMTPVGATYMIRGRYIWFCHSDFTKTGRLTIDEFPKKIEYLMYCNECGNSQNFTPK